MKKIVMILSIIILFLTNFAYAKYIFNRNFDIKFLSSLFYFDASIDKNSEELNINQADFEIKIKNYISDTEYNTYDVNYEFTVDNENFEVVLEDENNGVINSEKNENTVTVGIKAKDVPNLPLEQEVCLKVAAVSPYKKEFEFPITIINNAALIGDYVDYSVAYTDIYTSYEFPTTEGWRILDPGTRNSDGTYSNTKIITTGVPLKLYYNASQNPATTTNQNSKWWGTVEQINERYDKNLASWTSGNSRYFAAYGLEYNFSSIPFSETTNTTKNKGYYTSITNDEATSTTTGAIFLNSNASNVHAVTVEEMNKALNSVNGNTSREEKKLGTVNSSVDVRAIFYLRGLNGKYNYKTTSTAHYWLGSPNNDSTGLVRFQATGTFGGGTDNTYGVRPVITLKNKIYEENGIWKISIDS